MPDQTARDRVWTYSLNIAIRRGEPVFPAQIAEIANVSERMARSCLLNISEAEFLSRQKNLGGKVYYERPGWVEIDEDEVDEILE
jgi:hypothetical protein